MGTVDKGPPPFPNRSKIEAQQLSKLNSLLSLLISDSVFYSGKIKQAGLSPGLGSLQDFFSRMPFTLKEELVRDQATHPPYGTNLTFPLERYSRLCQTSGTTGAPLRWLDTPESWQWMLDNWETVYRASGIGPSDRIFFAFSFAPFLGFWTAFDAAARMGCLCLPGGGMSSTARLQILLDNKVSVVCCTPTYAIRLGEIAASEGIKLERAGVRTIFAAGEPGAGIAATRTRIESLWHGARLVDQHGMTEVGPVSFGCPQQVGVLHIIESAYLPEVIDPESGNPVGPGERGELVLTTLGRTASPLLRYRTGDLVERAKDALCACGRFDLALPGGILGRTDDMVIVRGVNIFPSAIEETLRGTPEIAEYRVQVRHADGLHDLAIQVEPAKPSSDPGELTARLQEKLREVLSIRIPVSLVPPGTLPRFEMKARRWVRL